MKLNSAAVAKVAFTILPMSRSNCHVYKDCKRFNWLLRNSAINFIGMKLFELCSLWKDLKLETQSGDWIDNVNFWQLSVTEMHSYSTPN
jgi:hypothetical protein